MSWKLPFLACLGVFTTFTGITSAQEMKDTSTGKTFPKTVTVNYEGKDLTLDGTGVSTRKKFFVKVYSIASYLENPSSVKEGDVFENILNAKGAKQLTQVYVRNVDAKRIQGGFRDSLNKVDPNKEFTNDINTFIGFFGAVKNGDTYIIQWFPDGTVRVEMNGTEKGTVKNEKFAKALWSIWFGKKSVVNRKQLVSELK